jgi:DNA-binding NarL/FixJ family response regulator
MNCKVLIYSKYPLVEMGLSLFVANKISKIQISKTNNLDFLLSDDKYDLMIFDVCIQSEFDLIVNNLKALNKKVKVLLIVENIDVSKLRGLQNITFLSRNCTEVEILKSIRTLLRKKKLSTSYRITKTIEQKEKLSKREVECAILLMKGYKVNEISKKLSLAKNTISTYKMRILKKTNTSNIVDLTKSLYNLENTAFKYIL